MLGRAVSSITPTEPQPSSTIGVSLSLPKTNLYMPLGLTIGWPYIAVGMASALDSLIGFPNRSSSAVRVPAFVMPADVSRSFTRTSWPWSGFRGAAQVTRYGGAVRLPTQSCAYIRVCYHTHGEAGVGVAYDHGTGHAGDR